MPNRIHIFGASGAGTSTLGAELAERIDSRHMPRWMCQPDCLIIRVL